MDVATLNKESYSKAAYVEGSYEAGSLFAPEREILTRLGKTLAGAPVLDVGVGSGRTTGAMLGLSRDYVGIDYSEVLVRRSRARHPGVRFETCDARSLSMFGDGTFAFALFSFNGIDYVAEPDRRRILAEIRRVLRPGGLLAFSAHNRDHPTPSPYAWATTARRGSALGEAKRLYRYARGIWNHGRLSRFARTEETYDLRIDEAANFSMVTYYIRREDQEDQLRALGFEPLAVLATDGTEVAAGATARDPWLYYLARRHG
jgi:SAM-dependent methyltransferase